MSSFNMMSDGISQLFGIKGVTLRKHSYKDYSRGDSQVTVIDLIIPLSDTAHTDYSVVMEVVCNSKPYQELLQENRRLQSLLANEAKASVLLQQLGKALRGEKL